MQTVPELADRIDSMPSTALAVSVFGSVEWMPADPEKADFNARIDALPKAG